MLMPSEICADIFTDEILQSLFITSEVNRASPQGSARQTERQTWQSVTPQWGWALVLFGLNDTLFFCTEQP